MASSGGVWDQLKAKTADDLIRALNRDSWVEEDSRGATRGFVKNPQHGTGTRRRVVIHYHPRKTYGPSLIKALIESTGWTVEDLKRLKLIKKK